ncbi:Alkyldihydroxyacetonephosphate synthase [Parelaphostrongylus tenuis]|uniref:Alkylglycerone-phosphate synthase n=1 Tax=Parelaphostrongylus tenuis TaxID=148309 RepID=A0AAD5LZV1_PARTN|nr:Alkyldihydroxyacetonephosphate synthase [Parelaphostrongylus tenuis]
MGQALKLEVNSYWAALKSSLSRLYITKWKGFHIDEMCAATCVFEGSLDEVNNEERRLYALAEEYNGVVGGEENGRYGYRLTFAIAYLRDLAMEFGVLGESFETSVPWDKVLSLCRNVKTLIKRLAKNLGVQYPVLASCRVTQVHDAGACVYFYFGFNTRILHNGLEVHDKIETAARDEIIACGGRVVGIALLKAIKMELDPANIFANANLVDIVGSSHSEL